MAILTHLPTESHSTPEPDSAAELAYLYDRRRKLLLADRICRRWALRHFEELGDDTRWPASYIWRVAAELVDVNVQIDTLEGRRGRW